MVWDNLTDSQVLWRCIIALKLTLIGGLVFTLIMLTNVVNMINY